MYFRYEQSTYILVMGQAEVSNFGKRKSKIPPFAEGEGKTSFIYQATNDKVCCQYNKLYI